MDQHLEYLMNNSAVHPSFWHRFTQLKLVVDKLEEGERSIWGRCNTCPVSSLNLTGSIVEVDSTSFNKHYEEHLLYLPLYGKLLNKNTIEQFKDCNKNELLQEEATKFQNSIIMSNEVLKNPAMLNYFFILSFSDLKKYHYYYWFAFPTSLQFKLAVLSIISIQDLYELEQQKSLLKASQELDSNNKAFFVINKKSGMICTIDNQISQGILNPNEVLFAFTDISNQENLYTSALSNYLALLTLNPHFKNLQGQKISLLAFRITKLSKELSISSSKVLQVCLPEKVGDLVWLGWERNDRGNMGPRMSNMKTSMDPKHLAETSVDLNLKLMKWRLLPDIDLDRIKETKCLLLGSGTLGCSVARVLLGWGVRHIDFVDNSTVSYSNPVRQSLFTFEDCTKARSKAEAAADNLQKIFPGVMSRGHKLTIPMPGHPVGQSLIERTKTAFNSLNELIAGADIIFLLMDSRESRWLPTLLSQYHGKIVINAALGFDTYLVMRHGVRNYKAPTNACESKQIDGYEMITGDELGCYFCNDVTAPGNSMKDRTLDQQCTVTRPGISQIAGALAVELAISITQHSHGALAPAYYRKHNSVTDNTFDEFEDDCLLGILPHSVRGFLSSYSQVLPATQRYKQCIACSDIILEKYKMQGFDFLLEVFESSKILEDLTGLTEIQNMDQTEIWDMDDSDEEFD